MSYTPTDADLVPGVKVELLPCGADPGSCSASIPLACEGCGNNDSGEERERRYQLEEREWEGTPLSGLLPRHRA